MCVIWCVCMCIHIHMHVQILFKGFQRYLLYLCIRNLLHSRHFRFSNPFRTSFFHSLFLFFVFFKRTERHSKELNDFGRIPKFIYTTQYCVYTQYTHKILTRYVKKIRKYKMKCKDVSNRCQV